MERQYVIIIQQKEKENAKLKVVSESVTASSISIFSSEFQIDHATARKW